MNTLFLPGEPRVIKGGGSIFPGLADYRAVAESLVRYQKDVGVPVVMAVSAALGVTSIRIAKAQELFPGDPWKQAEYVARGEQASAARLVRHLRKLGASVQLITAEDIGLEAWVDGDNPFHARLSRLNAGNLVCRLQRASISIISGYYALCRGRIALLGRGGTDLIAVALAGALGVPCCFCKDSGAVYAFDPRLVPGLSPRLIPRMSPDQALDFVVNGPGFLMDECVILAKQLDVTLCLMPSPTSNQAWQVTTVVDAGLHAEGNVVGVRGSCATVIQWGESLNGQVGKLVRSCVPQFDIKEERNLTRIFVPESSVPKLVGALAQAKELGLLQPIA